MGSHNSFLEDAHSTEFLTDRLYREILEKVFPELIENIQLALFNTVYFQQDGTLSHISISGSLNLDFS